ncbi:phosphoribosyl-AMP cyclohydrolase [Afifella sp. IM 167]|uniref:phosphoribosyl-AMP cyclohydrolase n=1 Tax=Afifella sp. IM 167 TaxID=2033586 RepID=UPI001CCB4501|nr:phosphoribosyl-AMP cyclohydrolase [Afifella sp. IM 167]MBZ8132326.1 phosphoribosyl-AMP cyclohydrolase [Afifella sp. IM 167]
MSETAQISSGETIEETTAFRPRFNSAGVLPCIAQDAATGDVLMLAWMNEEALSATLSTGVMHYWSRSRARLWKKGETSGAIQTVIELRIDCDQDTLLARVEVTDRTNTCHTGRGDCFYRIVEGEGGTARLSKA